MIKAVYDACLLYPATLRDFFLRLADGDLLQPFWSQEIQDEWLRNLLNDRSDLKPERLARTQREMNRAFPKSSIADYDEIIPSLDLPDANDRHVLAVAIKADAKFIVTFNLKHFPKGKLSKHGIEALSPDDFALRLIEYDTFIGRLGLAFQGLVSPLGGLSTVGPHCREPNDARLQLWRRR